MRKQLSALSFQLSAFRAARRGALLTGAAAMMLLAGCRQDMQDQPKIISERGSEFFADHRGARPQVANTVARGQLHEDSYFYTGVVQGANGYREEKNEMPFPVTSKCSSAARSGSISIARPAIRGWATDWHGGRARLQAGSQLPRPGALVAAHLALLLCDEPWLRSHA